MDQESGLLSFENDHVRFQLDGHPAFEIPAAAIRLIGEYTNESGPAIDDYFLVFVLHGSDECHAISFYAEGRDATWGELRRRFPGLADLGLGSSADFASRALWPPEVAGREFLEFKPLKRGPGVVNRMLDVCVPPFIVESNLRPEFHAQRGT